MALSDLQQGIQAASTAQPAGGTGEEESSGTLGQGLSLAGTAGGIMGVPGSDIASALGFGLQSMDANQSLGFGKTPLGPGILSALANTIAGKAIGIPDISGLGSTVSGLYGAGGQGMFGGASVEDFNDAQVGTTGFGRGLTPSQIDAVYSPSDSGPIDHAQNVADQIAQSNVNAAMADIAQSTGQAVQDVPNSGDQGMGFALKEGGMVNNNTPLKKLFMGIYE